VADTITLLNRGRSLGTFRKGEISRDRVVEMMAGGKELVDLETELAAMSRPDSQTASSLH
jgi:simple sugar transport system ATP-binding protein